MVTPLHAVLFLFSLHQPCQKLRSALFEAHVCVLRTPLSLEKNRTTLSWRYHLPDPQSYVLRDDHFWVLVAHNLKLMYRTSPPRPPDPHSYVLRGYHLRVLVAHNAEVCLRAGLEAMAHTWRMLGILLSGVPGGLLLPLGSSAPDVDVAGIDEGMAAALATAAASAGGGSGGGGAAGAGGRRNVDPATAGRKRERAGRMFYAVGGV